MLKIFSLHDAPKGVWFRLVRHGKRYSEYRYMKRESDGAVLDQAGVVVTSIVPNQKVVVLADGGVE